MSLGCRTLCLSLVLILLLSPSLWAKKKKYMDHLNDILSYYEYFGDYQKMANILTEEIVTRPFRTKELLHRATKDPQVYSYLISRKKMKVVIDNCFRGPLDVVIGQQHSFKIPLLSHKIVHLPPKRHNFIFSCSAESYLGELSIPFISPPDDKDHIIINVGRRNTYRIIGYDVLLGVRKVPEVSRGYPITLNKPEYFWLRLDDLFPPLPSRNTFRRRAIREKPSRFVTLYRIRPRGTF